VKLSLVCLAFTNSIEWFEKRPMSVLSSFTTLHNQLRLTLACTTFIDECRTVEPHKSLKTGLFDAPCRANLSDSS
jgi:hypothetical protein